MRILVIGGTGLISGQIVTKGLDMGHEMIAFNRGTKQCDKRARVVVGDRRNRADFDRLGQLHPDAVIDMICFDESDTNQTIDVFEGKTGQIVVASSVAAYDRPYAALPLSEDAAELTRDVSFQYGYRKAQMERQILRRMESGVTPLTIVRPSLTYGPSARNVGLLRQNYNIVTRIRAGKPLVMMGEETIPWTFTFAPDTARAFLLLCGNGKAFNAHFHLASDETRMWGDLYEKFGEIVGERPVIVNIPTVLLAKANPGLFMHLHQEKRYAGLFSSKKLREAIPGFTWEIGLEEGLRDVLHNWQAEGCVVDEEKNACEDMLCKKYFEFEKAVLRAVQ